VDALLSKTLGNIDLGPRSRPAAPASPPRTVADSPASVGATQPMQIPSSLWSEPVAPAAPPAPEPPRKSGRTGEIDFSELEELARPGRRPEPERPAAPPAAAPAAPPTQVPFPGSPGATSLPISQAEEAELLFDLAPELPEPPPLPVEEPAPAPPAVAAAPPVDEAPPRNLSFDGSATQWIPIVPKEEGGEAGLRFGQYTLLERIAVGGMAELWKARMRGVEGFQKTVAIKKILSHMTDNSEFIDMFVDEAKLAAQLSHPNIVHIYDLGRINRDYYIAMEYVDGKDLRSLLNAARRRHLPLPPGLALLIAARLAGALDYAHRMRDFEGKEMNLVHRDVSPQNVLLTYEGDVKLCDFGIAKAVSKASHTQMGALKGKLQYMSPEQAWGRPVDSRSDIFSLGAVLFEMLTGERLFSGDSEMSVLEAVRQARVRLPRQIDPALPAEADEIVARALAVEPQNRFASAGEMGQRIEALLRHMTPTPTHSDLAAYIRQVLSEEPVQEEGEVSFVTAAPAPAPPMSPAPLASPAPAPLAYEPAVVPPPVEIPPYPAYPGAPEGAPVEPVAPLGEVEMAEVDGSRRGRGLLYAAIVFLILAAILTFVLLSRRGASRPGAEPAEPTPTAPAPATPEPSTTPDPAATQGAAQTGGTVAPAAQPAAAPAKPAVDQAQVDAIFDREMAKRTEALRRQYEEKERQLKREIEKNRAAARAKAPPRESAEPATAASPEAQPEPSPPPASLSAR
jgi:serine/threonine protein kinase